MQQQLHSGQLELGKRTLMTDGLKHTCSILVAKQLCAHGCCCGCCCAGVADEKVADEAEEGAEEAEGEESSALPAWPKYEGLAYQSELHLPCSAADIAFPPAAAVVATI